MQSSAEIEKTTSSIQVLTSLPNSNHKHIDYVIFYELPLPNAASSSIGGGSEATDSVSDELKAEERREQFFTQLRRESFEIAKLSQMRDGKQLVYCLLHCPTKRLMREAEMLRIEMKLKNCQYQENDEIRCGFFNEIRELFRGNLNQRNQKKLTARFEESISFMFEGIDDQDKKGPFNNTTRMLLVDHILKNLTFSTDRIRAKFNYDDCIREIVYKNLTSDKQLAAAFRTSDSGTNGGHDEHGFNANLLSNFFVHEHYSDSKTLYRGLPYMLDKAYFHDAFVLHEETSHHMYLKYLTARRKNVFIMPFPAVQRVLESIRASEKTDYRTILQNTWASFRNLLKYQPLWEVRDYFGESNAIYFAWLGVFISMLWFPSALGFVFFIVGMSKSEFSVYNHSRYLHPNASFPISNFYSNIFTNSFDNTLMPYFALIICLWGAVFSEIWKRENNRLSFEWSVQNYENHESDMPEYLIRKKLLAKEKNPYKRALWRYEKFWKSLVSTLVILMMIGAVAFELALSAVFRIHIKIRVFPDDLTLKFVFADMGSILINTSLMMFLNFIYKKIAKKLTAWENHRTRTEYQDSLIFKSFAFDFVNSYGPVFYLTYFRNINYENGILNLGPEYQDKCEANNCMPLLTTQLLVVLIIKPLPRLFVSVIYPLISSVYHEKIQQRILKDSLQDSRVVVGAGDEDEPRERMNEKAVLIYLNMEKSKTKFNDTIMDEYNEKLILYGYVIIFSASFSLAPLLVLIISLIDMRIDATRLLWLYRRPIGHKAQDIGSWFDICRFLNVVGIINNGFMVAFASNWSKVYLSDSLLFKMTFLIAFEYLAFFLWVLLIILFPDIPNDVQRKMRQEAKFVSQIISAAKTIKQEAMPMSYLRGIYQANEISPRLESASLGMFVDADGGVEQVIKTNNRWQRKSTKINPI